MIHTYIAKKFNPIFFIGFFLFLINYSISSFADQKIAFWDEPKKGANIFNRQILQEDIKAAKNFGIAFIRLAPDKFISNNRDFLIGNADNYTKLSEKDLKYLKEILDMFATEQMPVVLTMLSLSGSRWKQNNHDQDDLRIWEDIKFQKQAAKFWQDIALELKDHPAMIGYNILNEPHLERLYPEKGKALYEIEQDKIQRQLFDFYQLVISKIRLVDKNTPIILDSSSYGDPKTFKNFKIHKDNKILYSFHMYEPFEYTNRKTNKGLLNYPGKIKDTYWNKKILEEYLNEVNNFQKINNITSNRILVGEFGGHRQTKGLHKYFEDLISIFKENNWHFAFYAFREDCWDGMDYELGNQKLLRNYWEAIEKGNTPKLHRSPNHIQFKVLGSVKEI